MTQSVSPVEAIAQQVRQLRKSYGWSADRLAQEMTTAGVAWDRTIVANLENGRRRGVDVAELLALAYVLDCPPLSLLVPAGEDVSIAALPGLDIGPYELHQWTTGVSRLSERVTPDHPEGMKRWQQAVHPLRLYRRLTSTQSRVSAQAQEVRRAERINDSESKLLAESGYMNALSEWAKVLVEMQQHGMEWPALVPQWLEDAREMGMLEANEEE